MPKLLSSLVLRDGGSDQYITLAGAQPALGPSPSVDTGFTLITDSVGNTAYSNILGNIVFSSGSLTNSVLDQNISIYTVGTGSFIINAPTQFNNSIQFNTSATFTTAYVIGNFGSTSTTTGALIVNSGVGVGENITLGGDLIFASATGSIRAPQVRILGTATSTSTTTGAMTVAGGIGIGQDVVLGGSLIFSNAQGTLRAQQVVISGQDNSYSTNTGALVVYGGVGVGGSINAPSIFDNSKRVISEVVAGVGLSGGGVGPGVILTNTGVLSLTAGTGTHVSQATGNVTVWVDPAAGAQTLQSVTEYGNSTTKIVYFNTSTDATSSTVAGVVIAGGLGVVKNVIVSGDITARDIRARYVDVDLFQSRGNASIYHLDIASPASSTASLVSNALYVNGGVGVQQGLTVGGNGFFYGNLTVLGTFTTISSSVADVGRKVVAVSTSAGPSFLSIDSGITVGPINSPFVKLLFDGNSSWKSTGNIIPVSSGAYDLGTSSIPWGTLYSQNARILGTSDSVSTATGALTVVGGLGVGGTIYAGTIYSNGQVVSPGVANTSSGIGGGQLGSIPIQYAPGQTTFIPIGPVNSLLRSNGTTATWVTTSSLGIGMGVNVITVGTDTSVSTSTGNVIIWNNSTLQTITSRGSSTNQIITLSNNTLATSTNSGALKVVGGVGIGGALYAGGIIYSQGSAVVTAATLNTYGVSKITAGTDTAINTATGDVIIWNTSTLQSVTDRGNVTYNAVSILNPTSSTYNGLGALTVAGGVSVGGTLYAREVYDDRHRVITSVIPIAGLGINIIDLVSTGTTATFIIESTGVVSVNGTGTIGVSTDASGTVTLSNLGVTRLLAGSDTSISSSTGIITIWNTSTLQTVSDRGATTTNAISITNTLSSTSTITGALVVAGGVGIGGNVNIGGNITVADQTDSAGTNSGALIIAGGLGVGNTIHSKLLVVESDFSNISNASSNAIYTKGGFGADGSGRFGSSVQIDSFVNIGGIATITDNTHATTSNAGALRVTGGAYVGDNLVVMGDTYVNGNSIFVGQVTVIGTSTFVYSTNTVYTDNIIELHSPSTSGVWTLNDGKDIGLTFHYYDTQDKSGFLGRNNSTGYLEWFGTGTESINTFSGTYGTFRTGSIKLVNGTSATNTYSGDLTVTGGVGIGGSLYVGGSIVGTVTGNITGTANSATNIANGAAGQIPYQSNTGTTAFFGPGAAGQLLMSSGTSAPLYISTGSIYVGRSETSTFATSSTNVIGGTAGQLVYQSATGQTSFASTGTAGQLLMSSGTNAPLYISTSSIYVGRSEISTYASTATNIAGGTGGQVLYQSATGQTAFVATGTNGQLLMSAGDTNAPGFVDTSTLYVGLSENSILAFTANNIAGGGSGSIPYNTDVSQTVSLPIGSLGYVLTSDGTVPYWAPSTGGGGGGGGGGGTTDVLTSTSTTANNNFYIPFLSTSSGNSYIYADPVLRYVPGSHSLSSTASISAGSLYDGSKRVVTSVVATAGTGINITSLVSTGTSTSFTISNSGVTGITAGTDTNINTTTGVITIWSTSTLQTVSSRGSSTTNSISITNTTSSTSTTTGALTVAGGVGIGGNLYVGNTSYVAGAQIITTATLGNYAQSFVGGTVPNAINITSSTQATSTSTGSLVVVGGVGVGGNLYVGNTLTVLSTLASTGSISQNALYVAGGIGIAGSLLVSGPAVFQNNVTFSGTSTYIYSTNTVYTDNLINIHVPTDFSTTTNHTWTVDDGKDIGFIFHYYTGTDKDAFLGLAHDTGFLEWYSNGTEFGGVFTGTSYGTFKTGSVVLTNSTASNSTTTGALIVTGGAGFGGNVYVGGSVFIDGSLSINTASISTYAVTSISAGTDTVVTAATGAVTIYSTATLQSITDRGTTTTNIVTLSNSATSTSTTTGALIVTGGIGVGGNVTAGQGFLTNNTLIASYTSAVISSTATQNLDSWSTSTYRTAKYMIQLVDTGFSPNRIHSSELSVIHDGAGNVYKNEYGINTSVGELGTFNALVSGNNVQIQFTPSFPTLTPSSLMVKMSRITITA